MCFSSYLVGVSQNKAEQADFETGFGDLAQLGDFGDLGHFGDLGDLVHF